MIYFNQNKEAYAFKIENPLCIVPMEQWSEFSTLTLGEEYDVDSEGIVDLRQSEKYLEKQAQKEQERIAKLSLTRGDVFRGLLQAKQVTRAQIRAMIENNETLTMLEKEMALIDFDEALNFYRGNSLIDTLGATLGITSEQLDKFFETGDYNALLV